MTILTEAHLNNVGVIRPNDDRRNKDDRNGSTEREAQLQTSRRHSIVKCTRRNPSYNPSHNAGGRIAIHAHDNNLLFSRIFFLHNIDAL